MTTLRLRNLTRTAKVLPKRWKSKRRRGDSIQLLFWTLSKKLLYVFAEPWWRYFKMSRYYTCATLFFCICFICSGAGPSWKPLDNAAACVSDCVGQESQAQYGGDTASCSVRKSSSCLKSPAEQTLHSTSGAGCWSHHGRAESTTGWGYTLLFTLEFMLIQFLNTNGPVCKCLVCI